MVCESDVSYVTMFTFFGGKRKEGGQITYATQMPYL